MHRKKIIYRIILGSVFMILGCINSSENQMDDKLKNAYFAICYTPEFSKRFALPTEKAITLSKGLHAISIEVRPDAKFYHTYIHLYIDSALDLYTPDKPCNFYEKTKAEHFFVNQYNVNSDHDWILNTSNKNERRLKFRSQSLNYSKKGIVHSLRYQSVKKDFIPGISLLSMWIGSSFLHMRYGPGEILIQKNNVGDYLLEYEDTANPKHPENYYVFKVPQKLQAQIQPLLKHIDKKFKFLLANDQEIWVEFP